MIALYYAMCTCTCTLYMHVQMYMYMHVHVTHIDHPDGEAVGKAKSQQEREVTAAAPRSWGDVIHGEVVHVT